MMRHMTARHALKKSLQAAVCMLTLSCLSCVRTGLEDDCEFPIRLHYSYVYNREDRDLLFEEVPNLSLHLFDLDTGEPIKNVELDISDLREDGTYTLYAPPGRYCLVSWGGAGERYKTVSDCLLAEHGIRIEADAEGNVGHRRCHLWHAISDDILVNGLLTPTHEVELLKLSNDVNVTVRANNDYSTSRDSDRPFLDPDLTGCDITAGNGWHSFSGSIHGDQMSVRYIPDKSGTEAGVRHEFTTLSLHDGDDSMLLVSYDGVNLYSGSLTGLIAEKPGIEFDLDDEFELLFEVSPSDTGTASVTVSVNGWRLHDYEVSLR